MSRKALALSPGHHRNHRCRAKGADRIEAMEERQLSLCFEAATPAAQVAAVDGLATPKLGRARCKSPEPVGGASEEARPPGEDEGAALPAAQATPSAVVPEADADGDVLLRLPAVKAKTGLGRSTIYADMKKGVFPQPRRISARCVAWSSAAIQQWMDARPKAIG